MSHTIESLGRRVLLGCREVGIPSTEGLSQFIVATLLPYDDKVFYMEKGELSDEDANTAVEKSIERLSMRDDPSLETMRLQTDLNYHYNNIEQEAVNRELARNEAIGSSIRRIVEQTNELNGRMDFNGFNLIYKLVHELLVTAAIVAIPSGRIPDKGTELQIRQDLGPALHSVMPRVAIKSFCSLTDSEKICQLRELVSLVHGIRLFHSAAGDWSGAGLWVEEVVGNAEDCRKAVEKETWLQRINDKCTEIAELVDTLVDVSMFDDSEATGNLSRFAQDICYLRQSLLYLQSIGDDVEKALARLYNSRMQFSECLKLVSIGIGTKTAVAKEDVYPRFDSLTRYYNSCREELLFMEDRIKLAELVLKQLDTYSVSPSLPEELLESVEDRKAQGADPSWWKEDQTEGKPHNKESGDGGNTWLAGLFENTSGELYLLEPGSYGEYQGTKLKYQGYCPIALVGGRGLLIPGDPQHGLVRLGYDNVSLVACSSRSAVNRFMNSHNHYIEAVKALCRVLPPLIPFLQMQTDFPHVPACITAREGSQGSPAPYVEGKVEQVRVDVAIETDLHPERSSDKDYEWNEWRMREKLLKAVALRQKRTRSIQTDYSAFRRDSDSQVYLPKDVTTNTYDDKWTNPVIHKRYLAGMRGAKKDTLKSVDIKFDILAKLQSSACYCNTEAPPPAPVVASSASSELLENEALACSGRKTNKVVKKGLNPPMQGTTNCKGGSRTPLKRYSRARSPDGAKRTLTTSLRCKDLLIIALIEVSPTSGAFKTAWDSSNAPRTKRRAVTRESILGIFSIISVRSATQTQSAWPIVSEIMLDHIHRCRVSVAVGVMSAPLNLPLPQAVEIIHRCPALPEFWGIGKPPMMKKLVSGLRECGLNPHRAIIANPRLVLTASHDENGILNELPARAALLRRMGVSEYDVPYYLTADNLPDEHTVEKEFEAAGISEAVEIVTELGDISNVEFRRALRHRPSETKVDEAILKKRLLTGSSDNDNVSEKCDELPKNGAPHEGDNVPKPKTKLPKSTIDSYALTEALRVIANDEGLTTSSELARLWCEKHADRNVLLKCDRTVVEVFAEVFLRSQPPPASSMSE
ncbi:hypothetical protein FOL47_005126 [Perkinsus chesapeaki]|uniref:Cilia- and flagella-associated protein 206 n=1 Tax=Perkinsus chesapeaki TaxID=330153 RepID=A0A7J6LZ61_PERCH|nr:hypothetical protein FOL47_005126 [Perkinsus chesapeaki]